VTNAGCIAGGDHAIRLEHRLEARQALERGVGTHVLVAAELLDLTRLGILHGNRNHFVIEYTRRPRVARGLLRTQGILIYTSAVEMVLAREFFGGLGHGQSGHGIFEPFPQRVLERRHLAQRKPQRSPRTTCGACDIDSPPPTRHTSDSPNRISSAPLTMAWNPDPQRRFTVRPGVSLGQPARSAT